MELGVPTWRDPPGLHSREDQAGDDRLMCVAADQEVMAATSAGEHGVRPCSPASAAVNGQVAVALAQLS